MYKIQIKYINFEFRILSFLVCQEVQILGDLQPSVLIASPLFLIMLFIVVSWEQKPRLSCTHSELISHRWITFIYHKYIKRGFLIRVALRHNTDALPLCHCGSSYKV